jgi:hypothetical protein
MGGVYNRGLGLSPNPEPCQLYHIVNLNKMQYIIWYAKKRGWAGSPPLSKHLPPVREVLGSTLSNILLHQNQGAMWQPMPGPCGTIQLAKKYATCDKFIHPRIFHSTLPTQHLLTQHFQLRCHVWVRTLPRQPIRTVQSTKFCLFGKMNRT